ncbi:hypothetical protein KDW20_12035 [Burkholderia cenocepacia]|uniref:hypothetical protein n=1 Tax=Burkholderia cenocepacia TaxID=95486 RepID=UPI001B9DA93E|nr:hypothetical protein [Burkholderia cenocepacia]MBR8376507.1 hypothetical protein [Burkholderia cenocepacia]
MTEPILTRDQILKIVRKTLKENGDRDKLSAESFVRLYEALEEAWLEKVCGEPRAWVSWKDGDGYGFWDTKDEADLASAHDFEPEPLYALARSKP